MRARLLVLLGAVAWAAACELATHAFDYRTAPPSPPSPTAPACASCPGGAALLRPPCPSTAAPLPDATAPGRTHVYAARRSRFGQPADLASPTFDLGFALDCSGGGAPARCAPLTDAGWAPLPRGIDDALLTRILAPSYEATPPGRAIDLDTIVSLALEQGRFGILVAIDGWNGLPDDDHVDVTLRTSPGLPGGASPAWNGADPWQPYPDVDPDGVRRFALDRAPGYVTAGTLVVDARARGAALYRFGPGAAHFDLLVADLLLAASLSPTKLDHLTLAGTLEPTTARAAALGLATSLAPCAGGLAAPFLSSLSPRISLAPDMPADPTAGPTDPCDAISFGWSLDGEPALLADGAAPGGAGAGAACP